MRAAATFRTSRPATGVPAAAAHPQASCKCCVLPTLGLPSVVSFLRDPSHSQETQLHVQRQRCQLLQVPRVQLFGRFLQSHVVKKRLP